MIITDDIIKKFDLVKSDRHTGVSFINDAKIYETKIFDGLDVTIMDCDLEGETKNVRDKNLFMILVLQDRRYNYFLVSAQMLKCCEVDLLNKLIHNNIQTYDNNRE